MTLFLLLPTFGTACGRYGDVLNAINASSTNAPAAPALRVRGSMKTLTFSWDAADAVTRYRVLADKDGSSGFTPLSDFLSQDTTTFTESDVSVHMTDWQNARYQLEVCNEDECATSAPISAADQMLSTIGYLKSPNPTTVTHFGQAVAMSADGQTFAVAESEAIDPLGNPGLIYVYRKTDEGWVRGEAIHPQDQPDGATLAFFSLALSADGKVLAVGIPTSSVFAVGVNPTNRRTDGASWCGVAYVYRYDGTSWQQEAFVRPTAIDQEDAEGDRFGTSVALNADGTILAVGSERDDSFAAEAGAVHVFSSLGVNGWVPEYRLRTQNPGAGDRFGDSVSMNDAGDVIVVGAPGEGSAAVGIDGDQSDNSAERAGAVYVCRRVGTGPGSFWEQQSYLKTLEHQTRDAFGGSLRVK